MAGLSRIWGYASARPPTPNLQTAPLGLAPGATVTVYLAGTITQAPLFADAGGAQVLGNPLVADVNGYWFAYVAPSGSYDVQFSGSGVPVPYTLGDVIPAWPGGFWINVKASPFNAKGDGVTDDTAAIQAAIAALYTTNIPGPGIAGSVTGTLFFPRGKYLVGTLFINNLNATAFASGSVIRGEGMNATILVLKNGANGILWDLGGANAGNGANTFVLRDMMIDGNKPNQTIAAPIIRCRFVDRAVFKDLIVVNGFGDGILFNNSSVSMSNCQVFTCNGNGITVQDCDSVIIADGFINNHGGYGLYAQFINSGGVLGAQGECGLVVRGNHFEQSVLGEIFLQDFDNADIHENDINAYSAPFPTAVINVAGVSRWARITNNMFDQLNDIATFDDGSGTDGVVTSILFGAQTFECFEGNNSSKQVTSKIGGIASYVVKNNKVVDLGRNYSIDPLAFRPQAIVQNEGGHTHGGWLAVPRTNLLLWSEDFSNAVWTGVNIAAVTQVQAQAGNPYNPAIGVGFSSQVVMNASVVASLQQAVAGLAVVAGQLYTFSLWISQSGVIQDRDVRMEIYDVGNNLLARKVWIYPGNFTWKRLSVSFVAGGNYAQLNCRITQAFGTVFLLWGAQLNQGDLAPYVPTAGAQLSANPGLVGMSVTATKALRQHQTQATVGAAGGASALPATPTGYFVQELKDGTQVVVPYYAKA